MAGYFLPNTRFLPVAPVGYFRFSCIGVSLPLQAPASSGQALRKKDAGSCRLFLHELQPSPPDCTIKHRPAASSVRDETPAAVLLTFCFNSMFFWSDVNLDEARSSAANITGFSRRVFGFSICNRCSSFLSRGTTGHHLLSAGNGIYPISRVCTMHGRCLMVSLNCLLSTFLSSATFQYDHQKERRRQPDRHPTLSCTVPNIDKIA